MQKSKVFTAASAVLALCAVQFPELMTPATALAVLASLIALLE